MLYISSLYKIPKGDAAKTSFATPPTNRKCILTLHHYSSQKSFRIPDLSPPKKKKAHLARENKYDENH